MRRKDWNYEKWGIVSESVTTLTIVRTLQNILHFLFIDDCGNVNFSWFVVSHQDMQTRLGWSVVWPITICSDHFVVDDDVWFSWELTSFPTMLLVVICRWHVLGVVCFEMALDSTRLLITFCNIIYGLVNPCSEFAYFI